MSVIMKLLYLSTFILFYYLRTTTAFPRVRRTKDEESSKAPDFFCTNFSDPNLRKHCQNLNSEAQRYCSYKIPDIIHELCEYLHEYREESNRKKRGIAEECCHKSCSQTYIIYNYCKHPEAEIRRSQSKSLRSQSQIKSTSFPHFFRGRNMRPKIINEEVSQHLDKEVKQKFKKKYKKKKHHGKKWKNRRNKKCGCPYYNMGKAVTYKTAEVARGVTHGTFNVDGFERDDSLPPVASDFA